MTHVPGYFEAVRQHVPCGLSHSFRSGTEATVEQRQPVELAARRVIPIVVCSLHVDSVDKAGAILHPHSSERLATCNFASLKDDDKSRNGISLQGSA